MNIKSIKSKIEAKMNDWLLSITDEDLRKKVKKNLLVSGGSIVSMLLNEKVNDYDVYLKDMDVLFELATYYSKKYDTIVLDGRKKEQLLKENEHRTGIFHVSLENLQERQVKLFFTAKNGGLKIDYNTPVDNLPPYRPVFLSPNAISLSDEVQVVLRFNGNVQDIHESFDFVHATCYFTFEEGLVTNKEALESIITKQLKYQGSLYPLTSIIRMKKFIKRGWNINAGEMLKIMFQISELDLKNANVLEEQLIGVDVAYFNKLIEILRGIEDKETLTSRYLNTIIDKVFGQADDSDEPD